MTQVKKFILALGVAAIAVAGGGCSQESPKLVPPAGQKKLEKVANLGATLKFNPKVDILFVVDDSVSMAKHQKNLAANIDLFTAGLIGMQFLDYHIGVITTSVSTWGTTGSISENGVLVGNPSFVDRSTLNGMKVLKENLLVGTEGSTTEMLFEPVQLALTSPTVDHENAGFYRPDAFLVLIFITDTEDQSRHLDATSFYSFVLGLKNQSRDKVISYGVYVPGSDKNCQRDDKPKPNRLDDYFQMSNATTFSLCDKQYGQKLTKLGEDMIDKVGRTLYLTRPPIVDTIKVTFGTQVIPNDLKTGWAYDPRINAIVFGPDIAWDKSQSGAQVVVDFLAADYN